MKTLKLEESTAKRLYPNADKELKTILEETFGKEFFVPKKITDKVKTFDDVLTLAACWMNTAEGSVSKIQKQVFKIMCKHQQHGISGLSPEDKIRLIHFVLNEGWEEDFTNQNQYKYYPWFKRTHSGWVIFSSHFVSCSHTLGSGFYYKTSELALYAANTFLDIYKEYLPE